MTFIKSCRSRAPHNRKDIGGIDKQANDRIEIARTRVDFYVLAKKLIA